MNNYKSLLTLKNILSTNDTIVKDILSISKETFSTSDDLINVGIGIISELGELIATLDTDALVLNIALYNLIVPIKEYSYTLFTNYKIPNAYKLYDFIKIDLQNLKIFLINLLGE